ncbi:MAG TPA: hypothetical protein VED01_15705, partial [Burkholderiales bacterium]|nr:hypothetical protein [Burkholderiales bacterium]
MAVNTSPTFVVRGRLVTDFDADSQDSAWSLALLDDGRILVAGSRDAVGMGQAFALARYSTSGILDVTFGGDGLVTTHLGGGHTVGQGVALQPDGKAVVGGYTATGFVVTRYNQDGSLDTSFSGDGVVTTPTLATNFAAGIAIQSDGRIVVAGHGHPGDGSGSDFIVVRYNSNGSLDAAFDSDGKVTTDFEAGGEEIAADMAIQNDGKIVVVGASRIGADLDFAVARYNSNGTLDGTFGGDGTVTTPIGNGNFVRSADDLATSVALQSDGKILVAGESQHQHGLGEPVVFDMDFALVRYNADGTLDTTFSGDGKLTLPVSAGFSERAESLTLQADGKILVAGWGSSSGATGRDFVLLRLNADGTLDPTFSNDGIVTVDFGTWDKASSVRVQADGKILVAGSAGEEIRSDFGLVRLNADGTFDTTFGPGFDTLNARPTYFEGHSAVVFDSNVEVFDVALSAQGHYAGATLRLERHGGASAQDVFSATGLLSPLVGASALTYGRVIVGIVDTNSGGVLGLTFNANATQERVNGVLRALAYSNTSDAPPPSVQIDWRFFDGNTGTQGTGGVLAAVGSVTVAITGTTDVHRWSQLNDGQLIEFDPAVDALRFDVNASAANVVVTEGSVILSFEGKTVTLEAELASLTTQNISFPVSLGRLVVGDNTANTVNDNGANLLSGGAGNDHLIGLGGNDTLVGRAGDDRLNGGDEDDYLQGGPGVDMLVGGSGSDRLEGSAGADALDGGAGLDYAAYHYAPAAVLVDLGAPASNTGDAAGDTFAAIEAVIGSAHADTLLGNGAANQLLGAGGGDALFGRGGNDVLLGMDGNDTLDGGAGADQLRGDAGSDYASYATAASGVTVNLGSWTQNTGDAAGDTYLSIESVLGSNLNDVLVGDNAANVLSALGGNDYLQGRNGADLLQGGDGSDRLEGGAGA